jgi:signal transduction histidine kinase/CHASE3 domain sensor protein
MNSKKPFTSSFFLKGIFALSLFVLIFISVLTYVHTRSLAASSAWVMRTLQTNIQLEQFHSFVKEVETAQRGFIITRDTAFLKTYELARENVNQSYRKLEKMMEDSPKQRPNLDTLLQLIHRRYTQIEVSLKIATEEPIDQDLLKTSMLIGKSIMDQIRFQVNEMIDLELEYLEQRQKKYESKISLTPLFTLVLLLFALLIFIFSYVKINRDLYTLEQKNERLRIMAAAFEQAEKIGGFSSWQWNLQTGKLLYSDNQYRLFGVEPQSFEPTIDNFLAFVHSKDRHIITSGQQQVTEDNTYPAAFFRVIRQDGELRYFKSISKAITDAQGQNILIGINTDVTEQHLITSRLEDRNLELEQRNKELASFNYVASHDLQEPLRIVQTYISRFTEEETALMSERSRGFLSKIKVAVTRMRNLIDALLLFSRTTKTDKKFEETDLNLILENSKQDLSYVIEQSNATITSVELPTVNVIPFQIQQLFTNLIGNSIKYRKPNVPPVITIECESILARDFIPSQPDSNKSYCKISIHDNGIGFEPQYAEAIFTLFQRLHHDDEYEGTGIGLSICKKIVEHHGGFICAEGKPGVGATFMIYFP